MTPSTPTSTSTARRIAIAEGTPLRCSQSMIGIDRTREKEGETEGKEDRRAGPKPCHDHDRACEHDEEPRARAKLLRTQPKLRHLASAFLPFPSHDASPRSLI